MRLRPATSRVLALPFTGMLLAGLLLGLSGLHAGASAVGAAAATTTPTSTTGLTSAQFENRLLALTNARRAKIGCAPFRRNTALVLAARSHTLRMVRSGSFSHQVPREAGLAYRIVQAGYGTWSALAENIAWGQSVTPGRVFSLWMHSAPHRANIENCRLRDIGYGVAFSGGSTWATGDFGRHRR